MATRCTALQGTAQCILQAGHAGEHRADWSAPTEPAPANPAPVPPKRSGLASPRRIALSIGGLILILIVVNLTRTGNRVADTGGDTNVVPPAWQPAAFTLTDDRDVAYRWLTDSEIDCDIADRCWGMFVVSKNGCSSLYVELSIIDDAGNNVGYTNDVASGVTAGQQAKLIFDNFENKGSKARLSKVSCL